MVLISALFLTTQLVASIENYSKVAISEDISKTKFDTLVKNQTAIMEENTSENQLDPAELSKNETLDPPMNSEDPYLLMLFNFLLQRGPLIFGVLIAIFVQWISSFFRFTDERRKEYWMRKLNSYQDFYHHAAQLIELIISEVNIPEEVYWHSVTLARKAAYDAEFYDMTHPERTNKMKNITEDLLYFLKSEEFTLDDVQDLRKQIEEIKKEFYEEEKLLLNENFNKSWRKRLHFHP